MPYKLINQKGRARAGEFLTRKGAVKTPCFMPIATKGGVKSVSVEDMRKLDPEVILSNTYHLMLRPGEKELKKLGGLHKFMNWKKPILTDSGGFQVFSLAKKRKITADGVVFNSHIDGKRYEMSPEDSIKIQMSIGSDIMMCLDECVELPANREYLKKSADMTTRWAERCKNYLVKKLKRASLNSGIASSRRAGLAIENKPLLFGIVQGGLEKELRLKSGADLVKIGFDGYAVGGLSVGESEQEMYSVLDYICEELPGDKPRYLMGVGYPHQIIEAVKRGIDMFDCVIPTREARHGRLFLMKREMGKWDMEAGIARPGKTNKKNAYDFYEAINIKSAKFKFDKTPIKADSRFDELRNHSKAYLRHLFVSEDMTALRLATLNNLEFYLELMGEIRKQILK